MLALYQESTLEAAAAVKTEHFRLDKKLTGCREVYLSPFLALKLYPHFAPVEGMRWAAGWLCGCLGVLSDDNIQFCLVAFFLGNNLLAGVKTEYFTTYLTTATTTTGPEGSFGAWYLLVPRKPWIRLIDGRAPSTHIRQPGQREPWQSHLLQNIVKARDQAFLITIHTWFS